MRCRRFLPLWALGMSLGVVVVGSFQTEWWFWRHSDDHRSRHRVDTDLWHAIGDFKAWRLEDGNPFSTAILLLIAVGAGLLVYWIGMRRARPIEAADYKDAPGGAVPDGRVNPNPS